MIIWVFCSLVFIVLISRCEQKGICVTLIMILSMSTMHPSALRSTKKGERVAFFQRRRFRYCIRRWYRGAREQRSGKKFCTRPDYSSSWFTFQRKKLQCGSPFFAYLQMNLQKEHTGMSRWSQPETVYYYLSVSAWLKGETHGFYKHIRGIFGEKNPG